MAASNMRLEEIVLTRVVRLNAGIQGIVAGLTVGIGIFVATNWLILQGGHTGPTGEVVVGPHLSLLGQFFPGYRVTFAGSLIGFAYGFASGFGIGYFTACIYNRLVNLRDGNHQDSI